MSVEIDRETSGMESNSALGRCRLNVRIAPEGGGKADIDGRLKSAKLGSFSLRFLTAPATLRGISLLGGGRVPLVLWEKPDASET